MAIDDKYDSLDVIIIGAGLAGLCAARDLVPRGLRCVVLEAHDRGRRPHAQPRDFGND